MRAKNAAALAASCLAAVATCHDVNTSPAPQAATFSNPVLWQDYPDLDVFRVGDVFYYSSSTFAYSPGAPVLRSYDLVSWEPVTHSVPRLNFGAKYDLGPSSQAYVKGIWASSLRYRASTDTFHWLGCVESSRTYIWTAAGTAAGRNRGAVANANWNWTSHTPPLASCYYDAGLLVDDDAAETLYVAYGNTRIRVAQLSADGLAEVKSQEVYAAAFTVEGSRMYKINGTYYILVTRPAAAEYVLKSTTGPFGPYRLAPKPLVSSIAGPLSSAGYAHQGSIVDTVDGKWYYVAFLDAYPGGRIPVVAPLTWTPDGWPQLVTDSADRWGATYPLPVVNSSWAKAVPSPLGTDAFEGSALSHAWEWNHNPDDASGSGSGNKGGGLVLQTASVTTDLFAARNTVTQRILGPKAAGTFRLDARGMRAGDRAGAVLFRDRAAYIGVWVDDKNSSAARLVVVSNLTLAQGTWATASAGTVVATGPALAADVLGDVWLRVDADVTPAFGTSTERTATFAYSVDGGKSFARLGPAVAMSNSWQFFSGYRFGVFNHATRALGGEVTVKSFTMSQ
ncbi:arabinoxylan hydrolase [Lasiosphaeria miniovina]|uniref:Arabinoxylan hydrolase n=1 Tax=Lasiosphaeria miniovina TaxID=1954250 RepID=A0AA40DNG3_9PEZI|nr:arabinoxylan hydrolase [Lasiosphaeria miniovina]KAK0710179.1 arabinoxylan hydrolase [Lasiosphaeria miniovina]